MTTNATTEITTETKTLDCCGMVCPAPILATAKAARTLRETGGMLEISADDAAFPVDLRSWCRSASAELVDLRSDFNGVHVAIVRIHGAARKTTSRFETAATDSSLDCRGQSCPGPVVALAKAARSLPGGSTLEVLADDPAFKLDVQSWCRSAHASLISLVDESDHIRAVIGLAGSAANTETPALSVIETATDSLWTLELDGVEPQGRVAYLREQFSSGRATKVRVKCSDPHFSTDLIQYTLADGHRIVALEARHQLEAELHLKIEVANPSALATVERSGCSLLVLHNDREALLAALLVAVGAAAQDMDVSVFFTFWGLNLLRGDEPNPEAEAEHTSLAQRVFKWLMPRGPRRQKLGKLHMGGVGGGILSSIMRRYELMDVPELMMAAEEQGVRFIACTMSMQVMGITKRDLAPRANLDFGGVAAFVEESARAKLSLTF